jgi:CheY-like chemotaxis protein
MKKILLVDDNQNLAFLLQTMLRDEGYEVELARDGGDGYWAYFHFSPDLVITDIQMPVENGLELIKHIRLHNPQVKTIYMSGDLSPFWSPLEEEKARYQASFLEKPFSKVDLISLVSQFLG